MIFVDRREGSADLAPLIKTPNMLCELEFGDASFTGESKEGTVSVGVERKKIRDLLNSISTGRLSAHQLPGMLNSYDYSYIIVEGVWKGNRSGELVISRDWGKTFLPVFYGKRKWTAEGVWNYLTTIETFLHVPFRITRDARDTARTIETLYRWWQHYHRHTSHLALHDRNLADEKKLVCLDPRKTNVDSLTDKQRQVREIASRLPHIDSMRSIDVAKKFGSVKEMFEAGEKAWLSIPGIGKQTVKEVFKVLHE